MSRNSYRLVLALGLLPVLLFSFVDLNSALLWVVAIIGSGVVFKLGVGRWRGTTLFMLPLVLALAWVAPRGDNDGLWLLVFPLVIMCIPVMVGIEYAAERVTNRRRSTR